MSLLPINSVTTLGGAAISIEMNRCAYLVNSTPKYYFMLPLHFALLRRHAPLLEMPLILATEEPDHPICQQVARDYGVELLPLKKEDSGFLKSRATALQSLALSARFLYVLPVQEDFLLDRAPDYEAILDAMATMLHTKGLIASVRLMPCPGPKGAVFESSPIWAGLTPETDTYGFTFQATLWTLDSCLLWYTALCEKLEKEFPVATTDPVARLHVEIRGNFAENTEGQRFFWEFFRHRRQAHIGSIRAGPWPNAVYMAPWPYRPTAIVQGKLEPWASELAAREGMPFR